MVLGAGLVLAKADFDKEDKFKTMEELNFENGFASMSYTVFTEDNYVLSLFRIPGTLLEMQEGIQKQKPVVLFMPALDTDMMEYVINDVDRANAYILSRAGYDVWLGNNRGTRLSLGHLSLSTDDKEYWNYYQEDLGTKDVPAFADFITKETGVESMSYVGHSQGTTQFFMGASLKPDYYAEKFNLFVALAPVGKTGNLGFESLHLAAKHVGLVEYIMVDVFHQYNLFPPPELGQEALILFCNLLPFVCKDFNKIFFQDDIDNAARLDVAVSNMPVGSSYRNYVYYAQMINSDRFELYDYGKRKNKEIYGTEEPPLVPIQDYKVPTVLLSGDRDKLADPTDVAWLSEQLGDNVVFEKQYPADHTTFVVAKDMSFFSVDAVAQLHKYNPVPTED